jgi:RNA recognition motif-containing protein
MNTKIYVGNLPFSTTDDSLTQVFASYGGVGSAKVITDRDTGRSKGFGFVEMMNGDDARSAIEGLNGQDFDGRLLTVSEAKPRETDSRARRW